MAIGLLLLFFLTTFVIVEQLHIPILVNPSAYLAKASLGVACLSVALLVGDVFIPVPSSLIMVANGALFGIVPGTILSVIGGLGAAAVGFGLGRRGGLFLDRFVPAVNLQQADRLLAKWGILALILTRPFPLLAETTVIMAGTSSMPWRRLWLGVFGGTLPTAIVYAVTGALATSFESATLAFSLVLAIAGIVWMVGTYWGNRAKKL